MYIEKIRFPLVLPDTQIFTSASTPAMPIKAAAPVALTSHICCYICFTRRYSPQHIKSSGYAANNYVGPTIFISLLSTGCHSPSKTPPLVIASYNINSQLLALGNSFSLGSSLSLCLSFLPDVLQLPIMQFYWYYIDTSRMDLKV